MYNEGISRAGDVLDMAVEVGVVEKRGAYYSYNEDRIGHGRENTKDFLRQNPEIMDEISRKVRENVGALSVPSASDVKEEDTYTEDES
jgi:recombination protein RecA